MVSAMNRLATCLTALVVASLTACGEDDDPLRVQVRAAAPDARDQAVDVLKTRLIRVVGTDSHVAATGKDGIVVRFRDHAGVLTGTPMVTAHGRLAIRDPDGRAVLGAGDFETGAPTSDGPARDPMVLLDFTRRGMTRWDRFNRRSRSIRWTLDLDGRTIATGRTFRRKAGQPLNSGLGIRAHSDAEAMLVAGVAASGPLPTVLDAG
jgi:ribosomal protein L14